MWGRALRDCSVSVGQYAWTDHPTSITSNIGPGMSIRCCEPTGGTYGPTWPGGLVISPCPCGHLGTASEVQGYTGTWTDLDGKVKFPRRVDFVNALVNVSSG